MNEALNIRLTLIATYYELTRVLARLAEEGSSYALMAWDRLPALPPVWNVQQLAIALHVARDAGPLGALTMTEAAPEFLAYRSALWSFSQQPLYGPPPMQCLPCAGRHVVAACQMDGNHGGISLTYGK